MNYKIISKKTAYKGGWLRVEKVRVRLPTRRIVDWWVPIMDDFVAILSLDNKGNIYLVKEWRVAWEKELWQVPAGARENKNNSEKAILNDAKRELKEEAGLEAKDWKKLCSFANSSKWRERGDIYLARNLTFTGQNLDKNEILRVVKMPFKKAWNLLFSGKVLTNAYTLLAMAYAKDKLKL